MNKGVFYGAVVVLFGVMIFLLAQDAELLSPSESYIKCSCGVNVGDMDVEVILSNLYSGPPATASGDAFFKRQRGTVEKIVKDKCKEYTGLSVVSCPLNGCEVEIKTKNGEIVKGWAACSRATS